MRTTISPCKLIFFWYFWLKIQNTANRHVSSAFGLLAAFISVPLVRAGARWCALVRAAARCCAPTHPTPPPLGGGKVPTSQKNRSAQAAHSVTYSAYLNRVVHLRGGFMLNPTRSKK